MSIGKMVPVEIPVCQLPDWLWSLLCERRHAEALRLACHLEDDGDGEGEE